MSQTTAAQSPRHGGQSATGNYHGNLAAGIVEANQQNSHPLRGGSAGNARDGSQLADQAYKQFTRDQLPQKVYPSTSQ